MDERPPVRPIIATDHDTFCGMIWYVCPVCKISVNYKAPRCDHCGQPFIWRNKKAASE
jgi:hypothetical protein